MADDENIWQYFPDLNPVMQCALGVIEDIEYIYYADQEPDENVDQERYEEISEKFYAPVCGCDVCVSREIVHRIFPMCIDAALSAMVAENENQKTAPCCIVAARAWKYHVALLDIVSHEGIDPKDRALVALGMKKENK